MFIFLFSPNDSPLRQPFIWSFCQHKGKCMRKHEIVVKVIEKHRFTTTNLNEIIRIKIFLGYENCTLPQENDSIKNATKKVQLSK